MSSDNKTTAPIGPRTVTVLGSHWNEKSPWGGFDFSKAELRSHSLFGPDYHLGVPWLHPDDRKTFMNHDPDYWGIYRLRLKRGWKSFVRVEGQWCVSKSLPTEQPLFGTPPHRQVTVIEVEL